MKWWTLHISMSGNFHMGLIGITVSCQCLSLVLDKDHLYEFSIDDVASSQILLLATNIMNKNAKDL